MKKMLILLSTVLLALSLTACATTSGGGGKVKCPACGYEFNPDAGAGEGQ
ncbi:MAG TPA: hypothetical protein VJ910_00625 [Desulfuromonadales bacterium]|nr:hypothetical protein [Desulfuromonadales bacterium]